MPAKRQGRLSIRERTANNEVVVSGHKNADHAGSRFPARIGNGPAQHKVIDH
jgi:hypothetical protein